MDRHGADDWLIPPLLFYGPLLWHIIVTVNSCHSPVIVGWCALTPLPSSPERTPTVSSSVDSVWLPLDSVPETFVYARRGPALWSSCGAPLPLVLQVQNSSCPQPDRCGGTGMAASGEGTPENRSQAYKQSRGQFPNLTIFNLYLIKKMKCDICISA